MFITTVTYMCMSVHQSAINSILLFVGGEGNEVGKKNLFCPPHDPKYCDPGTHCGLVQLRRLTLCIIDMPTNPCTTEIGNFCQGENAKEIRKM